MSKISHDKDRFCMMIGACLPFTGSDVLPLDSSYKYVTLVPQTLTEQEKAGAYPHEKHIGIAHEMWIGTVDEMVDHFRTQLERTVACAETNPIPTIKCTNITEFTKPLKDHGKIEERQELRNKLLGTTPQQTPATRAQLMEMVGEFTLKQGQGQFGPTADPTKIDNLINALTILKEDTKNIK